MISLLLLYFCAYCNSQHNTKNSKVVHHNSSQSFKIDVKQIDAELLDSYFSIDTLWIVSTANFFFYPFGKYHYLQDLSNVYPFMSKKKEYDKHSRDYSNEPLYRFTCNQSYIKFFYDDEKKTMEIVSAKIFDKRISLINQVEIGMNKSAFIHKFTNKISPEQIKDTHVIVFQSGLYGIWHYYNFEGDTLKSFWINTACMVDKN